MTGRPPTPEHVALSCTRCGEFVAWAFPPVPPVAVIGACCVTNPVCVCPPGADLETCLEVDCAACDSIPVTRPCARAAEPPRPLPPEQGPGDYAPAVPEIAARKLAADYDGTLWASPPPDRPLLVGGRRDVGPWQHDDGTRCEVFLSDHYRPSECQDGHTTGPRDQWWCTEHQQHLLSYRDPGPRLPAPAYVAQERGEAP